MCEVPNYMTKSDFWPKNINIYNPPILFTFIYNQPKPKTLNTSLS